MIIDNAQAGVLLRGTCVKSVRIKNSMISCPDFNDKGNQIIDMDYELLDIGKRENETYSGLVDLITKVSYKDGDQLKFIIELVLNGYFVAPASGPFDTLEKFQQALEVNGLSSLISISRAMISTLTSNVFFSGCVKLPMINVFKLIDLKKEQEASDKD